MPFTEVLLVIDVTVGTILCSVLYVLNKDLVETSYLDLALSKRMD